MPKIIHKFVAATTSTAGLADKRQVLVNCSAESVDRQGDIVVQSGIATGNFLKTGGTVLWNHDPDTPIARALSIGIAGGQLRSLVQFPDPGVSAKADEIYGLVIAGVVNSTSIGFMPIKWEPIEPKEPWGPAKFLECELMEFSFVSVPAQTAATVIERSYKSAGSLSADDHIAAIAREIAAAGRCHEKAVASHATMREHLERSRGLAEEANDHIDALTRAGRRRPPSGAAEIVDDEGVEMNAPPAVGGAIGWLARGVSRREKLAALDHADVGATPTPPANPLVLGGAHLVAHQREKEMQRLRAVSDAMSASAIRAAKDSAKARR